MNRKDTGDRGENLARNYLKKKGYRILETNYRCRTGEIDIVAGRKKNIVFVEVRTKTDNSFGTPSESVTRDKKEKLISSSLMYLSEHDMTQLPWRIDFIGIEMTKEGEVNRIEHIENAVSG